MTPNEYLDLVNSARIEEPSYYERLLNAKFAGAKPKEEVEHRIRKCGKSANIYWFDLSGNKLGGPYTSLKDASTASGVHPGNIKSSLRKDNFTAGGYRFKKLIKEK